MCFLKFCASVHLLSIRVFHSATVMIDSVSGSQRKTEVLVLKSVLPPTNLAKYSNTNNVAKNLGLSLLLLLQCLFITSVK